MILDLLIQKHHFIDYDPNSCWRDPIVNAIKEKLPEDSYQSITAGSDQINIFTSSHHLYTLFPVEKFLDSWRGKPRSIRLIFKSILRRRTDNFLWA